MNCRFLFIALAITAPAVRAEQVDYVRDVKPILKERCYACHGALKQESGLRLDTAALLRQGSETGAVVSPGRDGGTLLERVTADEADGRMPPEGKPLTAHQIALLTKWIQQGAQGPTDEQPEASPQEHWAFQPPVKGSLAAADGGDHPIDTLLDVGREKLGLKTVGLVDKRLLLRRVYLDLTGLPPSREQMHAFLADDSAEAYERVVQQLLDSPHYGERWGRHWMDVWRYTDWYGLGQQLRYSQKHIWHWRDWIIESLNQDKGYDRMVMEMLAADEIAATDHDALRATGFLARNYFLFNRTTWLDNTIEHTSKAFLGLTMNCTKCHDHKYDPLSQQDYYRLRAVFEPHQVRLDPVPGQTDLEKDGLPRVFDAHPDAKTYLHIRGDASNPDTSREISPGVPEVFAAAAFQVAQVDLPPAAHNPALQDFVLADHLKLAQAEIERAENELTRATQAVAAAEAREQQPTSAPPAGAPPTGTAAFLKDDFSAADDQRWEIGPGQWQYENGVLKQTAVGATRKHIRTRAPHPPDFVARLKFKTLSGQMWKSVGLCFDVTGEREKLVYLSAVTPGSKLQISYNTGGGHAYPPEAKQDRAVQLNELYELEIAVRDRLMNVSVDGRHALAYRLPVEREPGRIDLIAFDAAAEFHAVEIRPLAADVQLVDSGTANPAGRAASAAEARAALLIAEKTLAAARLRPAVLQTSHAADAAKCRAQDADSVTTLQKQAALAARRYELARAEEAVARSEHKLATATDKTKAQAEKELTAARTNLEKARQAVEQPGTNYDSLRVSAKALEGPAESAASQQMPYPAFSTGRRTALARWITDRQNPLTARVAVNHIWMRHFGQPLVDPVTDFGRRTEAPAQQALLDWLAVELMENDWSMKHLHRLIVTSQAYRLETSLAGADQATIAADPENHYYWRRRPQRMESQIIRDSMLSLAGVLNPELGGPTIDPKRDDTVYRRSLYFTHSRDDQHAFLSMFDDADILRCYRRAESIVPQQALTLANSKLALSMARKIAAQLPASGDREFIVAAFEMILCSEPLADEIAACQEALDETRTALKTRGPEQANRRARENLVHALLNHNDFITIR